MRVSVQNCSAPCRNTLSYSSAPNVDLPGTWGPVECWNSFTPSELISVIALHAFVRKFTGPFSPTPRARNPHFQETHTSCCTTDNTLYPTVVHGSAATAHSVPHTACSSTYYTQKHEVPQLRVHASRRVGGRGCAR